MLFIYEFQLLSGTFQLLATRIPSISPVGEWSLLLFQRAARESIQRRDFGVADYERGGKDPIVWCAAGANHPFKFKSITIELASSLGCTQT